MTEEQQWRNSVIADFKMVSDSIHRTQAILFATVILAFISFVMSGVALMGLLK